jgi:hypothetical protein
MLTIVDVAAILRVSDDTVLKQSAALDGVIDIGTPAGMHRIQAGLTYPTEDTGLVLRRPSSEGEALSARAVVSCPRPPDEVVQMRLSTLHPHCIVALGYFDGIAEHFGHTLSPLGRLIAFVLAEG